MTQYRHHAAVAALGDPAAWPESGFWTQVRVLTARSLRTAVTTATGTFGA